MLNFKLFNAVLLSILAFCSNPMETLKTLRAKEVRMPKEHRFMLDTHRPSKHKKPYNPRKKKTWSVVQTFDDGTALFKCKQYPKLRKRMPYVVKP